LYCTVNFSYSTNEKADRQGTSLERFIRITLHF